MLHEDVNRHRNNNMIGVILTKMFKDLLAYMFIVATPLTTIY